MSFVIRLVLTLALMVRRVKHQVSVPMSTGELGALSLVHQRRVFRLQKSCRRRLPWRHMCLLARAPLVPVTTAAGRRDELVKSRSYIRFYYMLDDRTYDSAVAQIGFEDTEYAKRADRKSVV